MIENGGNDESLEFQRPDPSMARMDGQCQRYRALIEAAASAGGTDRLLPGQASELDRLIEELGVSREEAVADVAAWTGHLTAQELVVEAMRSRDGFRSIEEIDLLIDAEKVRIARALGDLTAEVGALVRERLSRRDAEKAVGAADRRTPTPPGLSWAFRGFPKPAPSKATSQRQMNVESI